MKNTNNHTNPISSVDELICKMEAYPERFSQLGIFLHREGENSSKTDYQFLMITSNTFGKVTLMDLKCEGDCVILEFRDCVTGQVGNVRIDVHDVNPKVLFISWNDVKNMVCNDINSDSLLEFEF